MELFVKTQAKRLVKTNENINFAQNRINFTMLENLLNFVI